MSQQSPLSQWIDTVSSMLPKLSCPQAKVWPWSLACCLLGCVASRWYAPLSAASGEFGAEPAATPTGMVLWRRRQYREEARDLDVSTVSALLHGFWRVGGV